MHISKKSWHYRLLNFWSNLGPRQSCTYDIKGFPPHDLCSYMQSLLWNIAWQLFVLEWVAVVFYESYAVLWNVYHHIIMFSAHPPVWQFIMQIQWGTGLLLIVAAALCAAIFGFVWAVIIIGTVIQALAEKYDIGTAAEEPFLFRVWLQSIKDKTCIILTSDDEE